MLKVFYVRHDGVWLGGLSLVVAHDVDEAKRLVVEQLIALRLKLDGLEVVEVDTNKVQALILDNGDY